MLTIPIHIYKYIRFQRIQTIMENIGSLLRNKVIVREEEKPKRKGNPMFGMACSLQEKIGIPLPMCFKLLKKYTPQELSRLVSWWSDYPFKKANNIGLLLWKLKQLYPTK